jgi:HEAT repeat protein
MIPGDSMKKFALSFLLTALWGPITGELLPLHAAGMADFGGMSEDSREDSRYQRGSRALDERQWERAVEAFEDVIQMNGSRKDGALYWKAYAQNKQGLRAESLSTLDRLQKEHPNSRWLSDAKALEVEIRQASGQAVQPEDAADEELKLIALNSLMHTDSDRAIPMLETFLRGNQSPKLKERALFVLSQSKSPKARDLLGQVARGASNPDLQLKAIRYLGLHGGREARQTLSEIYAASNDASAKKAILQSFMVAGDKERLLTAARSEQAQDLRMNAIDLLGVVGAQTELWDLYKQESAAEVRERILRALFVGGNSERLIEVAKTDKDPKLRLTAIRHLGTMRQSRTGDSLVEIYEADTDAAIRKTAIHALFVQGNAKGLVALARKETDASLKKEIVSKLSIMKSPEAVEYLMEILNK